MYKRTIKYTDYNDVEREEDFYFNISQPEILELQNSVEGGLEGIIKKISATKEFIGLIAEFKRLLLLSIGQKTPDGRFVKSEQISAEFVSSAAYEKFFVELATDNDAAAAFIEGMLPKGFVSTGAQDSRAIEAKKILEEAQKSMVDTTMPKSDISDAFKAPPSL